MKNETNSDLRTDFTNRDAILKLLSEDETAKVSSAETAAQLSDGDEYVDMEQLDQGVRRVLGKSSPVGHVVPRKAVKAATWTKIVERLTASAPAASSPPIL